MMDKDFSHTGNSALTLIFDLETWLSQIGQREEKICSEQVILDKQMEGLIHHIILPAEQGLINYWK